MYCDKCGDKLPENSKFCTKCGMKVVNQKEKDILPREEKQEQEKKDIIKCGNCGYVGVGEPARSLFFTVLAWVCVLFSPLITIIYFVATHKYRCPKCKSTFLGVKNKKGVFVGQRGGVWRSLFIFLWILLGIAIIGILSAIVLVSLSSAREKARLANETKSVQLDWQKFNSVENDFSVLFPTYPEIESENDISAGQGDLTYSWHSYTAQSNDETFHVFKYSYSFEIDTSDEDKLLESYLNTMVNADDNNQLVSSSYTYYSSYRALDFLLKNKDEFVKGRIIESGQTPYLLIVEYSSQNYTEGDYEKFINSFVIK